MAEFNNSAHIGPFTVAPTEQQLADIDRYDKATGSAGRRAHTERPASYMDVELVPGYQVASGGSAQATWKAPWPCTVLQASMGAEVHGGSLSALTGDLLVEPAAGGGFATVLDAPEDLLTPGAGVTAEVAPEEDSENLAYGDKIRFVCAATADTADGARCSLRIKRL